MAFTPKLIIAVGRPRTTRNVGGGTSLERQQVFLGNPRRLPIDFEGLIIHSLSFFIFIFKNSMNYFVLFLKLKLVILRKVFSGRSL